MHFKYQTLFFFSSYFSEDEEKALFSLLSTPDNQYWFTKHIANS